jgi:hypothetical protein
VVCLDVSHCLKRDGAERHYPDGLEDLDQTQKVFPAVLDLPAGRVVISSGFVARIAQHCISDEDLSAA